MQTNPNDLFKTSVKPFIPFIIFSLHSLLSLAALTSPVFAERLRIVWSEGDFTISGPNGGNQEGHWSNFAIIDKNGDAIFTKIYPGGYAACQIDDGRKFAIEGIYWSAPRKFLCVSNTTGNPLQLFNNNNKNFFKPLFATNGNNRIVNVPALTP